MGITNVRAESPFNDPNRMGGVDDALVLDEKSPAEKQQQARAKLHSMLMEWMLQERDKQSENRYQMAIDEDYYDGLQWSDEDAQELIARGQAPLVYNLVKPTINWLLGTERRTRIDGKVLPREEDDEEGAEVKTKLLKYLSDVNRTPFSRSEAWESCVVAGLGWMEDSISRDPSQELLATRYVDWKSIYHDSNAKMKDLSDGRFIFRWSFLDVDVAMALCPEQANTIRSAAIQDNQVGMDEDDVWHLGARVNTASSGDYASVNRRGMQGGLVNTGRDRVKVIEAWYRMPVNCLMCRSEDPEARKYHGEKWNPEDQGMVAARDAGYMSISEHVRMEMNVAVMTESVILYSGKSPYKHNRFPFTPMWCYRRKRDLQPYGVIRDIRDAQSDYNKRASKALFILSTVRVVMDKDAYEDIDELRSEIARPDGIFTPKRGARFDIAQDKELAQEHIALMQFDGKMIRDVGGVTEQNLGHDDKGLSGQAIGKLQDQGSIVTAVLFDNMRLAVQIQTESQLSLMEQYYTAAKVVRIVGENKPVEWLKINQYDEAEGRYTNDITKSQADFIVSEQDFKASIRQAMFESLMDLVSKLPPQIGLQFLDLVVDFADVPNKDELVKRIRAINGQSDPSRKPTPEEQQQINAQQQKQAEVEQVQIDTAKAELAKAQASAKKMLADADQSAAKTKEIVANAIQIGVTAAYEALQAAQIVATVPNVTPVADAVLAGAGYVDQGGQDPNLPPPTGALPAMTAQPMHGSYIGSGGDSNIDDTAQENPSAGIPPAAPAPGAQLQQADGAAAGIETARPDGVA